MTSRKCSSNLIVEEEYEIDIDDKYAEQINTISDAIRVVEQIISEGG